jgi:hypothetical protein
VENLKEFFCEDYSAVMNSNNRTARNESPEWFPTASPQEVKVVVELVACGRQRIIAVASSNEFVPRPQLYGVSCAPPPPVFLDGGRRFEQLDGVK